MLQTKASMKTDYEVNFLDQSTFYVYYGLNDLYSHNIHNDAAHLYLLEPRALKGKKHLKTWKLK